MIKRIGLLLRRAVCSTIRYQSRDSIVVSSVGLDVLVYGFACRVGVYGNAICNVISCSSITFFLRLPPKITEVIPVRLSIGAARFIVSASLTAKKLPALPSHPYLIEALGSCFRGNMIFDHFIRNIFDFLPYDLNRCID